MRVAASGSCVDQIHTSNLRRTRVEGFSQKVYNYLDSEKIYEVIRLEAAIYATVKVAIWAPSTDILTEVVIYTRY